jgi:exopolyphosphatase/guanosine-5'-triphosphate,3'-diphosphate pyrophosphatase
MGENAGNGGVLRARGPARLENLAAVDIGTNSVRLLITDPAGRELERHMQVTRLGQGVDVTGELHPDAVARTVAVLSDYGARMRAHGVTRARAAATSAARDAKNSQAFFDAAEAALGVRPELLPGEDEARFSFLGATAGLDPREGPFLVVDIGGGSTEFVLGTTGPEQLISVDMGCVRMTERHLRHDPPTASEREACAEDVRRQLERVRAKVEVGRMRRMLGLAGTITALGAMAKGLTRYDPGATHRMQLTREQVRSAFEQLAQVPAAARRSLLIEPKRAEVIVGGALVLLGILERFDIPELTVSESDILDGLAASLR